MADKLTQLIVEGLTRAAAEPAGMLLYASRSESGLFLSNSSTKPAVRRCLEEGLLESFFDNSTRPARELARITEKGTQFLVDHASPKQVLEDFVRILEARKAQCDDIARGVRHMNETICGLKTTLEAMLPQVLTKRIEIASATVSRQHVPQSVHAGRAEFSVEVETQSLAASILSFLADWSTLTGAGRDCPLPELYKGVMELSPGMTIGTFHDQLRDLHASGQVYLHPWTGPLYTLPEPTYAILVGHNIAYYASARQ